MQTAANRGIAWFSVCAILLQAFVFAWHHHPLALASADDTAVVRSLDGSAPLPSTDADQSCQLCAALHHLTAAPGEFAVYLLPPAALPIDGIDAEHSGGTVRLAFHARAPPLS
jgi:hypothetical protein